MPGWTPRSHETRQKDFSRAKSRASSMRREPTTTEARFWKALRQLNREGFHFRRQLALQDRVFDFGDYGTRVLIEVDGGIHRLPSVVARDREKEALAVGEGFRLLRLTNDDIWNTEDAGRQRTKLVISTYSREETRAGLLACVVAYIIWGLLPLYMKVVSFAEAMEILAQRVLWSIPTLILGVALISGLRGGLREIRTAMRPRLLGALTLSAALIFVNWGVYVWAVVAGRVLDAALAYFLAPLVQVAIGVAFDKERLSAPQWAALALATVGVLVQGAALGAVPWVSIAICATWCAYGVVRRRTNVPAATGLLYETVLLIPAAAALLFWIGAHGDVAFDNSPTSGLLLALTGPATAIPLALFAFGARRLRFSTIGLLQYIAPTLQFLIGAAYGEHLNALRVASFALIWAGLALFSYDLWRRERAARVAPR